MNEEQRAVIARLWARKLSQDARGLPKQQRHRNLEPDSAELICALASGCRAQRLVEIGGSSGISTIALAEAARRTGGQLISIEIEPTRQAEARQEIGILHLTDVVIFHCADAAEILPQCEAIDFLLIDCEKEDYIRFYRLALAKLAPGAVVVADNILSHHLTEYVDFVRSQPGVESVTLPIGKGLEVTRIQ